VSGRSLTGSTRRPGHTGRDRMLDALTGSQIPFHLTNEEFIPERFSRSLKPGASPRSTSGEPRMTTGGGGGAPVAALGQHHGGAVYPERFLS